MEVEKYNKILEYKCRGAYPPEMKCKSIRANFRSTCKLYTLVDGKLFRRNKEVLRADDLTEEVSKVHGVLGLEHKCGLRKLEETLRQQFDCLGLRPKLLKLCQSKCSICQLTATGTVWFLKSIRQFKPLDETAGREVCRKLGVAYQGVPTVEYNVPFRSPLSVDVISPNGNCVWHRWQSGSTRGVESCGVATYAKKLNCDQVESNIRRWFRHLLIASSHRVASEYECLWDRHPCGRFSAGC